MGLFWAKAGEADSWERWKGDCGGQQRGCLVARKSFQMPGVHDPAESTGSGEGLRGLNAYLQEC